MKNPHPPHFNLGQRLWILTGEAAGSIAYSLPRLPHGQSIAPHPGQYRGENPGAGGSRPEIMVLNFLKSPAHKF